MSWQDVSFILKTSYWNQWDQKIGVHNFLENEWKRLIQFTSLNYQILSIDQNRTNTDIITEKEIKKLHGHHM